MPGGALTFDDLYCTFMVSEDYSEWIQIYEWIRAINFGDEIALKRWFATADLVITTNKFNPLLSFNFEHVFPYLLGTVDLTQDITSADTLISNVTFKFLDMEVKRVL
jgi:hypothetical protein